MRRSVISLAFLLFAGAAYARSMTVMNRPVAVSAGGGGASVAISRVVEQRESPVGTTETIAFSSAPASNSGLALFIATYGESVSNVTDAGGNTWTKRAVSTGVADTNGRIYLYTARAASSPGTITITKTNSFGNPAELCLVEVINTLTSADPFDDDGVAAANGTSASATADTTATGALLVAASHTGANTTLSPGSGMTLVAENEDNSSGVCIHVSWKRVTGGGAQSGAVTLGAARDYLVTGVNLKEN